MFIFSAGSNKRRVTKGSSTSINSTGEALDYDDECQFVFVWCCFLFSVGASHLHKNIFLDISCLCGYFRIRRDIEAKVFDTDL